MTLTSPAHVPDSLAAFFSEHPDVALAFSGGTDSAYLLYAATACGCRVRAYYLHSSFQPAFELADARRLASALSADLVILEQDVLQNAAVAANPPDRCYHCKRALFGILTQTAQRDGFSVLIDGTNASDDPTDRPGMRALRELAVRSPLQECGITKPMVRELSRAAGLFTWSKPAYACLATRVPAGTPLTAALLHRIEESENALFALGFTDFRVRVYEGAARIQLPGEQMAAALLQREQLLAALSPLWRAVLLDLAGR